MTSSRLASERYNGLIIHFIVPKIQGDDSIVHKRRTVPLGVGIDR